MLQSTVSSGDEPEDPEKVEAEAVATAVGNHLDSLDGAFLEALTSFADTVRREDTSTAREPFYVFGHLKPAGCSLAR